jgi:hypothetical protein
LPLGVHRGCNNSLGTFGFFSTDENLQIQQPLSQFFASQLINLEWVQPGNGEHKVFPASSDVRDGAGHVLVTSYAVLRPDGTWALMIVNKDQENAHSVQIAFDSEKPDKESHFSGPVTAIRFGSAQYQWHPDPSSKIGGRAEPDGPAERTTIDARPGTIFELPKASITVLRGTIN